MRSLRGCASDGSSIALGLLGVSLLACSACSDTHEAADQATEPLVGAPMPPTTGPDDPFVADGCLNDPEWTLGAVEAKLPAGKSSVSIPASVFVRFASADCARGANGSTSCGAWHDIARADLRHTELALAEDPVAKTFTVAASAFEPGSLTERIRTCGNGEPGDQCAIEFAYAEVDFGVHLTPKRLEGFVGVFPRNPASIFLGQAFRTAVPEGPIPLDTISGRTSAIGYSLGATDTQSFSFGVQIAHYLAYAVPDSSKDFAVQSVRMTTSCARAYMRSPAPTASTTSWTETVGAILFRY